MKKNMFYVFGFLFFLNCIHPFGLLAQPRQAEKLSDWNSYFVGDIVFKNLSPDTDGSRIYNKLVSNPKEYIAREARKVLETLYFSPSDSIPGIKTINYTVKEFD